MKIIGASNLDDAVLCACENGLSDMIPFFLENGAKNVDDAFDTAFKCSHYQCLPILIQFGVKQIYIDNLIENSISKKNLKLFKVLWNHRNKSREKRYQFIAKKSSFDLNLLST